MNTKALTGRLIELDEILARGEGKAGKQYRAVALVIDLAAEKSYRFDIPANWVKNYVSGPALGARLWGHFIGTDADDIVITAGSGDNICVTFKNPISGKLSFNSSENSISAKLIKNGLTAVVLKNKCRRLSALIVSKSTFAFKTTEALWGMTTGQTEDFLKSTCIAIGPAGENLIHCACAVCEGKSLGRGGLGKVMGQKNLKAVCIESQDAFIKKTSIQERTVIQNAARYGWAAVDNFTKRTDPRLFNLSFSETSRRLGRTYSGYFPTWQENLMLGSNTGCYNPVLVAQRFALCIEMGIDPVSMGNLLGFLKVGSDNDFALKTIEDLSVQSLRGKELLETLCSDKIHRIGNFEAGPFDVRGDFTQALNQGLGNSLPIYPALVTDVCRHNPAFWTAFGQDIELGMESLGVSSSKLLSVFSSINPVMRLICRYMKKASVVFVPALVCKKLSLETTPRDLLKLGRKSWRLIHEINEIMGCKQFCIDDYFCVEPESNCDKSAIVPSIPLYEQYVSLRNRSAAFQDSTLFQS